ncbi:unnamed protein product [Candidula unifasciata]|uniref:CRAL-TRIO domain-containing protein n=1 Tax=Candidula unifasciata TaxID=100452 RepID=A0A8S4A282_9EUPU|nr:unnamed protein product [Candidula unifasciata]
MFKPYTKEEDSYTCTLSLEVQQKAKRELNEDPKTRLLEVKSLRTRLQKVPGLLPRTDVKFLLRFLRARKFDQERTFELAKRYYDIRMQSPEIFNDLKPTRVRHVFADDFIEVLKHRNNEGCRVIICRPDNWDTSRYPLIDFLTALYLVIAKIAEEEDTQVCGVHLISYLEKLTFKHATQITPGTAKFFVSTVQDVLPMRLKRFDFVKQPAIWDIVFTACKPFMKSKLLSRIVANGDMFEKLHAVMSPEFLPTDLGGQLPPHSNRSLLASDTQFEEDNKFGFVKMNVNSGNSVSKSRDADMQGLGGTFKKLEI